MRTKVAVLAVAVAGALTLAATPAFATSVVAGPIARAETISRSIYWINRGDTNYSQDQADAIPDGDGHKYRPDCSGFVAMTWHLAKKSDGWDFNTTDFASTSLVTQVALDDLKAGDAILKSGHIELFDKWIDPANHKSGIWTYAEHDYGRKTEHDQMSWSYLTANFHGIRYIKILDSLQPHGVAQVADGGNGTVAINRWQSTGTAFTPTTGYSGQYDLSQVGNRVAAGDVNGDGATDVVTARQNADGTFAFDVFGGGVTPLGTWYTSGQFDLANAANRLVVADFNGDGKAEPAIAYDRGTTMTIFRWKSTGTSFTLDSQFNSGAFSLGNVGDRMAAGDVTGDGIADIVMAYQLADGTFAFYVFKSGSTSLGQWYKSGQYTLAHVGGRLVLGDFNFDGKAEPDLVYDNGDGTAKIYHWTSTGSAFTHQSNDQAIAVDPAALGDRVAAGDVTGDGVDDLVLAVGQDDGSVTHFVSAAGTGTPTAFESTPTGVAAAGRLLTGAW
jgi:hypothetical protein